MTSPCDSTSTGRGATPFHYRGHLARFAADGSINIDLEAVEAARALGGELDGQTSCLLELADHVASHPEQADDANRAMQYFTTRPQLAIGPLTVCDVVAISWTDSAHVLCFRVPADLPPHIVDRLVTLGIPDAFTHPNLSDDGLSHAVALRSSHVAGHERLSPAQYRSLLLWFSSDPVEQRRGLPVLLRNPAIPSDVIEAILAGPSSRDRAYVAINPALTEGQRERCRRDLSSEVRAASCCNPSNTAAESAALATDPCDLVRRACHVVRGHPRMWGDRAQDVVAREWLYQLVRYPTDVAPATVDRVRRGQRARLARDLCPTRPDTVSTEGAPDAES